MKKLHALLIALIIASTMMLLNSCGGLKIAEGDLGFLKGVKSLNIQYDYSEMGVGKYATEEEYVDRKVSEYNEKEKGKGDTWHDSWKNARKSYYQPKFEDLLNKQLDDAGVSATPGNKSAKYTMILKTTFTEPGWNIYISRRNASINVEVIFIETGSPNNVLARLIMHDIQGRTFGGSDYDVATRLSESYAKCGKDLGKFLREYF